MRSLAAVALGYLLACSAAIASIPGFPRYSDYAGSKYRVGYTKRSITLNDEPALFVSGSLHPPRIEPADWNTAFDQILESGGNMVQPYVFWNFHQPTEEEWIWEGRANLTAFIEAAANKGLFVVLRGGPYVCAEWSSGAVPVWLNGKPGISYRTENAVWQHYMQQFFDRIIKAVGEAKQFAAQGGPVVIVQVENELHGAPDSYVQWCGDMAHEAVQPYDPDAVIIMCNGQSANNTVNTCNGKSCTGFIEENGQNHRILVDQPPLWTEAEGGFQVWGGSPSDPTSYFWGQPAAQEAFNMAQWFARGGSHANYYMFSGGSNPSRFAGAGITQYYAIDGPVCSDLLPHEPKYSHLTGLHRAVEYYAPHIAYSDAQVKNKVPVEYFDTSNSSWATGTQQYAFVYQSSEGTKQGVPAVAFVESVASIPLRVRWRQHEFDMGPNSVAVVDEQEGIQWLSSAVTAPAVHRVYDPIADLGATGLRAGNSLDWSSWGEPITAAEAKQGPPSKSAASPIEQGNFTSGVTEYMWYETAMPSGGIKKGDQLSIASRTANSMLLFADDQYLGEANDHSHHDDDKELTITASADATSAQRLSLLSATLGYSNDMGSGSGPKTKGIIGAVKLGNNEVQGPWTMRGDLTGNFLEIASAAGKSKVSWTKGPATGAAQRLTWLQAEFVLPRALGEGERLHFNATGLGRGHLFLNGNDVGRYWTILRNDGSGQFTQTMYHLPTAQLNPAGQSNVITVAEVLGATAVEQPGLFVASMQPGSGEEPSKGWGQEINSCKM